LSSHRTIKKIKNKMGCSATVARAIVCKEKRNCGKKKKVVSDNTNRMYSAIDIERFFNG